MKFIGQYIQSFIARFRNDVYLEDIDTGTIVSGGNLGLDSNNKIVKATDGDITSVRITTDSGGGGTEYNALSGDVDLQIIGASGVGVTNSGATITVTSVPGEIDHDSLANFVAAEHYRWDTDISSTATINAANIPTLNQNTTGQAGTVATIAGLAPNTATTQAAQPAIESIGTDGDTLAILADQLHMSNATSEMPVIKLTNTTDDDVSSELIFEKLRDDDAVASGQNLGAIWFRGQDTNQVTEDYAYIIGEIDVSTHTQESGKLTLGVANHDGGNGAGLILTGGSENNEIDVTVGLGANSVVTIPGDIDLSGTISSGTWQGTAIASAYLDADTAHLSTSKQCTYYMMVDDIDTTKIYIPLQTPDTETSVATNKQLRFLAPFAGKLLKVFLRANTDLSSNTLTWTLETRNTSSATSGTPTVVGTQSGAGCTNKTMTTYDFTTSLDSGDNIIDAGDTVQLAVQSDAATANSQFYITCLWEWNLG